MAAVNPHKSVLRNLKKKAESIATLKGREDLDAAQLDKLKTEKKVLAELATMEKKYKEWEVANASAPAPAPTPTLAPAQKSAKNEKKPAEKKKAEKEKEKDPDVAAEQAHKLRNLTKKLRAIEDLEEKIAGGHVPDKAQKEKLMTKKEIKKQIAEVERLSGVKAPAREKKQEKKPEPPAKKPAPKKEKKVDTPQMDPKAEKTARNRLKNLRGKLDAIAELKKADELTDEQATKVKSEKKVKAEIDELTKKLAAHGLSA